jgi:hypothetical protein
MSNIVQQKERCSRMVRFIQYGVGVFGNWPLTMWWGLHFFRKIQKMHFPENGWIEKLINATIINSSRAFHWMVMLVGFDNLNFLDNFCVPPLVTEVAVSPLRAKYEVRVFGHRTQEVPWPAWCFTYMRTSVEKISAHSFYRWKDGKIKNTDKTFISVGDKELANTLQMRGSMDEWSPRQRGSLKPCEFSW